MIVLNVFNAPYEIIEKGSTKRFDAQNRGRVKICLNFDIF